MNVKQQTCKLWFQIKKKLITIFYLLSLFAKYFGIDPLYFIKLDL